MKQTNPLAEKFVAFIFKITHDDSKNTYVLQEFAHGPYNLDTLEMSRVKTYALGMIVEDFRNVRRLKEHFKVNAGMRSTLKNLGYATNDRWGHVYETVDANGEITYLTILGAQKI